MNDQTRVIYIIKRKEKLGRNKCSLKKKTSGVTMMQ